MEWLKKSLELEFTSKLKEKGSILRGTSIATKVVTFYCRSIEKDFMKKVLSDSIQQILKHTSFFEVDKTFVSKKRHFLSLYF